MGRPAILDRVRSCGYLVFDGGAFDLNCVIVRATTRLAGPRDDELHWVFRDSVGVWVDIVLPVMADPSPNHLLRPERREGCAILRAGQFRGMWALGLHHGRPALVQVGPCAVWRDDTLDLTLDHDEVPKDLGPTSAVGIFGINHHSGTDSAGCVTADQEVVDVGRLLLAAQAAHGHGSSVTVTVLEE